MSWWKRLWRRRQMEAQLEKELRFLSRAPRFRLVFMMGFSFGLLIWAPMAFGRATSSGSRKFTVDEIVSEYRGTYGTSSYARWSSSNCPLK